MSLKYEVDSIDDVPEGVREAYTETEDGKFRLQVEGVIPESEVGGLKSALDKERANAKNASKELQRYRERAESLEAERDELLQSAGSDGERKRIKESYERRLESLKSDHDRELENERGSKKNLLSKIENLTVNSTASSLASRLAVDADSKPILERLIRDRLRVTIDDDESDPRVLVLDREGKETERTIEDLEKEVLDDKSFARLVTDTRGSGGGGSRGSSGGGTSTQKRGSLAGNRNDRQAALKTRFPDLAD